ncbi:putative phospholipase A1-II 1-like [Capsicum annuum]|nr:putative phospholipase A1-II 1-like [Capsicum annuum]
MPQAIGDSFNSETASKYYGTSRYSEKNLFKSVGFDKNNPYKYEITKYFYAASDVTEKVKESNWIGFVGVATDEGKVALVRRDILIAWRGTLTQSEWNDDKQVPLVQPTEIFRENTNNILVHKERGLVECSENDWRVYEHLCFEVLIDITKSKYLKKCINSHILEVYLHGIAGTHGPDEEFKLEINWDIALTNKADDVLKDEYGVPVSWWIEKNKGMIQHEDGSWILMDHEDDDTYFLP